MDTSGLASGLSLAAFLTVFGYLSLLETASSLGSGVQWPLYQSSRLQFTLRFLKLATVIAVALSALAVVLSQSDPSVGVVALASVALLAFLAILDRAAKLLSARFPGVIAIVIRPGMVALVRLVRYPRRPIGQAAEVEGTIRDRNGVEQEMGDASAMVITEEEQASLDARERLMIRSILRLDESTAKEVMVPRVDMVAVDADTPLTEVSSAMLESAHSRLPVFKETLDHVIGAVYSRDLLPFLGETQEHPALDQIIRPAFFIPESKRLDELLKELQEKRIQMAIVVDEYGGVEGLVTLEDLLEEIVGEIEDEFSRTPEPRVVPMANGDIVVDARVTLDYLSDLYSTSIGNDHVDTVGGLVYSTLGKMPQVGDEIVSNGLRIQVVSLLGRRIRKLQLSRAESDADH